MFTTVKLKLMLRVLECWQLLNVISETNVIKNHVVGMAKSYYSWPMIITGRSDRLANIAMSAEFTASVPPCTLNIFHRCLYSIFTACTKNIRIPQIYVANLCNSYFSMHFATCLLAQPLLIQSILPGNVGAVSVISTSNDRAHKADIRRSNRQGSSPHRALVPAVAQKAPSSL